MKIKKISSRKRIKISYRVTTELGFNYWDLNKIKPILEVNYGLRFTSRRIPLLYFQVIDQKKYMMFLIRFGHLLK